MHPRDDMQRVVGGARYTVGKSDLIASDEYSDGSNLERNGRNTFLFKTEGGAFFRVNMTMWQGERDKITPVSEGVAIKLYEALPEHLEEYEETFGVVVAEAVAPGRPPMFNEPMTQTAVWLPEKQIEWLKAQAGTMGGAVRGLIDDAMATPPPDLATDDPFGVPPTGTGW